MAISTYQTKISKVTAASMPTSWDTTKPNAGKPIAGDVLVARVLAGNAVSAGEAITDPAVWTPVYTSQPVASANTNNRGALQAYIRIADGSTNDNAPTITLSASSRAICMLSEYQSSVGWPSLAALVEAVYASQNGASNTAGQSVATGSGTAGATTAAIILGWALSLSSSQTFTPGFSMSTDGNDVQGSTSGWFGSRLVSASTTGTPAVALGVAGSNLWMTGGFALHEAAPSAGGSGSHVPFVGWGVHL